MRTYEFDVKDGKYVDPDGIEVENPVYYVLEDWFGVSKAGAIDAVSIVHREQYSIAGISHDIQILHISDFFLGIIHIMTSKYSTRIEVLV